MIRFAAALLLGLALSLPASAQDKLTLLLDWYVNPDHGPIIIAREKGFFRDEGLEVEVIAPADPSEPPKLVAAGKADLAVGYQPQLHLQVHEGLPLVRVGTLVATPLNCLMVDANGPIKSLADLRGRRIGYSISGVEEAMMAAMLGTVGLTRDDVEMINVNWSLTPSLMTGQVDAVIGAFRNFELTQMRLAGGDGRCFFPEEAGMPSYDELIFLANSETLDRDRVARFLAAIERATEYMLNHPEDAFATFAATAPDLSDALNTQAWADTLPRFAHSPAALDQGRYARFETFLHAAGLIDSVLPVSALALDPGAAGVTGPDRGPVPGPDYGRSFAAWKADCPGPWAAYTRHAFVEGLRDGALPGEVFLAYLRQDYVFLIHFARAWSLAVVKAGSLAEMRAASATVQALLTEEMSLHLRVCAEAGISEAELIVTEEAPENLAYTRYVLETGYSGDFLDLLAALAPCVLGYGEIGARLRAEAGATPYRDWIETYGGASYQALCRETGALIDGAVADRLGAGAMDLPRWRALSGHFATATRLEAAFWACALA